MININNILDNFIVHPEKKVLILKGKWGVGKTYFWKNYINSVKCKNAITEKAVSYVSLFGKKDISEIKNAIYTKAKYGKDGENQGAKTAIKNLFHNVTKVPGIKDYSFLSDYIENKLLDNYIICFDDIERKDHNLQMDTILGLVSILKEENKCRIILILNEELLAEPDKDSLNKYREKVVDLDIEYSPSIEDNTKIIFTTEKEYNLYLPIFKLLGLNNIRIMKQIKWNVSQFKLEKYELNEQYRNEIIKHVCVLSVMFYDKDYGINISDLVLSENMLFNNINAQAKNDMNILFQKYGISLSIYDTYIRNLLQKGYFDFDEFNACISILKEREKKSNIKNDINKIWNYYGNGFMNQADNLIVMIDELLTKNCENMEMQNLLNILDMLKSISPNDDISKWEDKYVLANAAKINKSELEDYLNKTMNKEVKTMIEAELRNRKKGKDIKSIIIQIGTRPSWGVEDEYTLSNASEDEYYTAIMEIDNSNAMQILQQFHEYFNSKINDSIRKEIGVKFENALKKIKQTDKLNEYRIKHLFKI